MICSCASFQSYSCFQARFYPITMHFCFFLRLTNQMTTDSYRQLAVAEDGLSALALCRGPHLYLWSPFAHVSFDALLPSSASASASTAASSPSSSSSSSPSMTPDEQIAVRELAAHARYRAWLSVPLHAFAFDNQVCVESIIWPQKMHEFFSTFT